MSKLQTASERIAEEVPRMTAGPAGAASSRTRWAAAKSITYTATEPPTSAFRSESGAS